MKAALVLAALLLGAQQQTFYSATAKPKPVPAASAQPIGPVYLYVRAKTGRFAHPRRPAPRHPAPRHT